ncbi:MAG: D-cysteine desulfhydrase [Clostridiales bacterium 38_11]|nr:MAG: D-cysteine desulfhydrase [Clostridiales bacterium 38_11]
MEWSKWKRRIYTQGATPIQYLDQLTQLLQGPNIFVKRDDMLGLVGGGSKTRKLEFLMADAIGKASDCIITCGDVQSNHCRLTLSAANYEGLDCHLILEERIPNSFFPKANGNNLLYQLLGASSIRVVPRGTDLLQEMDTLKQQLESQGFQPYVIPVGGSNPIGDLGYIACAEEILVQTKQLGIRIDQIVCASGSGGTHAGLVAGFKTLNTQIKVIGIGINRKKPLQDEAVHHHILSVCEMLDLETKIDYEDIIIFDDYIGEGYSLPTEEMKKAVRLLAKKEAILLDPVYTGKAMAGMIDLIKNGYFKKDDNILFLHTGGIPGLYAHANELMD